MPNAKAKAKAKAKRAEVAAAKKAAQAEAAAAQTVDQVAVDLPAMAAIRKRPSTATLEATPALKRPGAAGVSSTMPLWQRMMPEIAVFTDEDTDVPNKNTYASRAYSRAKALAKRHGLSAADQLMEAKSAYSAAAKSYFEYME